jgi:small-conductance mechanosensitive channel
MAILFIILFVRIVIVLSNMVCSPNQPFLRLLNIGDTAALNLQRATRISLFFVGSALTFLALVKELGISIGSLVFLAITLGTLFILLLCYFVMHNRQIVTEAILSSQSVEEEGGWVVRQLAALWHVLALLYLFVVWLNYLYIEVLGTGHDKGALLLSLLAVPLFLLFDHIGQWVVQATVGALRLSPAVEKQEKTAASGTDTDSPKDKERLLMVRAGMVVRIAILCAVGVWVLSLWEYHIPYAKEATRAVFESLVTLAVALLFWRAASTYLEGKIAEATPETKEEESDDGEWGAATQKGRSYTLLPMVRKFIGTVLTVMVTLIILSSIGVNIGPLLAGAGVIGLAVGFGAQKLVSDVLSGFFYLLDDAFRVGEYVQAGGISGTVENITLRNVMLRHHRGMLQIVPYSDLGSITNFMRGGMVIKFNLEFPYNTDVDLVRRTIKKVGQAMLEEDEYKDDFIQPLKSQGVREITNSVMVIRVKFTAKPGGQFLIQREAYRRITEALMAKGIHYAHRKIIVELPDNVDAGATGRQKIAEAGAAAGLSILAEEEKKKAESKDTSP